MIKSDVIKKLDSKNYTLFRNFSLIHSDFKGQSEGMAFLVLNGVIAWMGSQKKIPKVKIKNEVNLKKKIVFPSFVECHTHSVFAGSRAEEFEMRNQGVSYLEIAEKGGGILSTVTQTRKATKKQLTQMSQSRVNSFLKQGVSTLEIKSGYGLNLENEMKILEVAKSLKGPDIITTYLGAHAKPNEFNQHEDYLNDILKTALPVLKKKKLANRIDIFIEKNFFEIESSRKFLKSVVSQGFQICIHANQFTDSGAADLALDIGAISADHVIFLNDKTIQRFAKSETVAVLLPAADLYMKCAYPPARKLIDAGATVALATDFNPGSCPSQDLMLVGLLARLEMKMSLAEVFKSYTLGAARALGLEKTQGVLGVGKLANFICTDAELSDFFYAPGVVPEHQLFIRGMPVKVI